MLENVKDRLITLAISRRLLTISIILLLVVVICSLGIVHYVNGFRAQPLSISTSQVFEIEQGESATRVILRLKETAGIDSMFASRILFKVQPQSARFKAGIYDLLPADKMEDVLVRFQSGETKKVDVTLVEGQTWKEWWQQLSYQEWINLDVTEEQLLTLVSFQSSRQFVNLEGLIMPDTYQLEAGSDLSELLMKAHQTLMDFLQQEWGKRQFNLPLNSPYEALVLASIIEKETAVASERPHIAAVFINRLNLGMRLQTDPTVIYGIGEAFDGNLTRSHLKEKTPYNTYRINGLPPTPIAMPGREAIIAALNPIKSQDLYFVAKGDGSHKFSATLAEHNAAVRRYQLGLK